MGIVYAAWHLDLDLPIALKLLTATVADSAAVLARFRREVRAAAKIRSEHVARVLDVGALDNGQPFMVLELLEGNDLEQELSINGPVPVLDAVDYILQAVEALAEAHAAGIVHRDLKPANLFLAVRPDRTRLIKVLDFGISKSLLSDSTPEQVSLTQTGMMMGSPLYMSPEQMQSTRDADARCDIWALGVVLYQMLTGKTPFQGSTIVELCAAVLKDQPLPLSHYRSDVPLGLDAVVTRCLQRDRHLRYQNLAELALALVPFAPDHARVHCERSQRVLFPITTESHAPSLVSARAASNAALPPSTDQVGTARSPQHFDHAHSQSPSAQPVPTPGTHVAWNAGANAEANSDELGKPSQSAAGPRRKAVVPALAAGFVLAGAIFVARAKFTSDQATPSSLSPVNQLAPVPFRAANDQARVVGIGSTVTMAIAGTGGVAAAPIESRAPGTQSGEPNDSRPSPRTPTQAAAPMQRQTPRLVIGVASNPRAPSSSNNRSKGPTTVKHAAEQSSSPKTTLTGTELPDYGGRR